MKKLLQIYTWLKWKLYDEDFCLFFFFILLLVLLICCGCKSPKIIKEETVVRYVDSTIVNYIDSIIEIEVPKEKIVNVVALPDTLNLETSIAKAKAWVDTTTTPNSLKGELTNKPDGVLTKTVYLPQETRVIYRDSIQKKEIPVKVEVVKYKVPKITRWLIVVLLGLVAYAYRKFFIKLLKYIASLF